MKERIKYWVEMAEYDLETARVMLKGRRLLYVGFMCHQAIEKILKAYFVHAKGENPPYTHNLTYLATQSELNSIMSEERKDFIDLLEPLNVEARYPTDKDRVMRSLTQDRCEGILKQAEELFEWIRQQLSIS